MTFDSAIPTTRDRIRLITGDTSNDAASEYFPDETYDAEIERYENWKLAAAVMAEAVAVELDKRRTGFAVPGDISVQWGDTAKTLRAAAVRLRQEAAAEDAGGVTSVALSRGGSVTAEYRAEYRRLWRR